MIDIDRRSYERLPLRRPCKLYVPRTGRYLPASTCDVCEGGAMVRIDRPAPLEPGDHAYLGIATKRRQAVLVASEMVRVQVVRATPAGDQAFAVAVRFVDEAAVYRHAA